MEVAQETEEEEAEAEAAAGEKGAAAAAEGARPEAAEVVVGAAETALSTPGTLQMTSQLAFALWGGRFSAVISSLLIGRGLADRNYNSRQASDSLVPSLRRTMGIVVLGPRDFFNLGWLSSSIAAILVLNYHSPTVIDYKNHPRGWLKF